MVYEINKVIEDPSKKLSLEQMIPREYHEILTLFLEAAARTLPPHRTYNHMITLKDG